MKKAISFTLALAMACSLMACGNSQSSDTSKDTSKDAATETTETAEATDDAAAAEGADSKTTIYIPMISKGFQHQFWQTAKKGAEDAAAKAGVEISFNGPPSESDIDKQVDMVKSEISKNPSALCLAALSTDALMEQLQTCVENKIPVIGFDSGVPDAPDGAIYATACTNNGAAAAVAAQELAKLDGYTDKIAAGTADKPVVIGILAQDATSDSITSRSKGYVAEVKKIAEQYAASGVSVEGHELYNEPKDGASVIIKVQVSASSDVVDVTNAAKALLNTDNLLSVFCSNEGAVTGFLAATADGSDLGEGGKYEGLIVAGFDAGATQKEAVRNGWFVGSITQDPYNIGYQAIELAVKAINGEKVEDVDTGAKWYTKDNIDDPDIAQLVYD
ncbi:MAG: ABC transporter substrate-binding protein [Lachnospiraceae bacterium]|nr:ABC transporter substrate-binding protein [Lachnospiraceae bacterium]